ncbi:MAG TPA: dihydrofolate reductase family protein [Pirellulales bacterium]|nr:dihydrofolate reductase family protein [Pirellulales bacterium]
MPKLIVFNQVSLDGYFIDAAGDMSWAHRRQPDAEWQTFVEGNASQGGRLLFGRVTYEMMASFWPTPTASQTMPTLARQMNALPKIVFSRSLTTASWHNTRLVQDNLVAEVHNLKSEPGPDIAVLGSGSIVAQLAEAGLVDEFQVVVNPVVLGGGRTMFQGVGRKIALGLTRSRVFQNGNVLLCYAPVA